MKTFKKIKHQLRVNYPQIHRFLSRLIRLLSKETCLYRFDKVLPTGYRIQKIRSPYVYTQKNNTYNAFIEYLTNYQYKHYKPTFDSARVVSLIESTLFSNSLNGDLAECGVYQGSTAKILHFFAASKKNIHLFDTFVGFTEQDLEIEEKSGSMKRHGQPHINTSLGQVRQNILSNIQGEEMKDLNRLKFHIGPVPETLEAVNDTIFSLVHLDMDLYEPTRQALNFFIPRLCSGGLLILHDYAVPQNGYIGIYKAIKSFAQKKLIIGPLPFGDQASSLFIKR